MESPLLLTINCSIGDKNKHLNAKSLSDLFLNIKEKENHLSAIEKYAIEMIKTEAKPEEIEWFKQDYSIPQESIDYVLSINLYAR